MANYAQTQQTTLVSLLEELDALSKAARSVREKLLKIAPVKYGSDLWWEKSDQEALEQIKRGEGVTATTEAELKKLLGL